MKGERDVRHEGHLDGTEDGTGSPVCEAGKDAALAAAGDRPDADASAV